MRIGIVTAILAAALLVLVSCGHTQGPEPPPGISYVTPSVSPSSPPVAVWGVGGDGGVYATQDGGASWHRLQSPAGSTELWAVALADAATGFVVGSQQILSTVDGGVHWKQDHLSDADLGAVAVACDGSGGAWVGGQVHNRPVILSSTDGGATWTTLYEPQKSAEGPTYVTGLAFSDARHGWAALDFPSTVIARTSDGGHSWQTLRPRGVALLRAIACTDARHAWAVGQCSAHDAMIIATSDGGAHWRTQYAPTNRPVADELEGVAFVDSRHGWAVGHESLVLATDDGGRHWRRQDTGLRNNWSLESVTFSDLQHGWIALGGGHSLLWTDDGGEHWHALGLDAPGGVSALAVGSG